MKLRVYQDELVTQALTLLTAHDEICFTSCTGSGKTVMSAEMCARYLKQNPRSRVLISGHGQTIIRDQIADEYRKIAPRFSFSVVTKETRSIGNEQVIIAIPQSLHHRTNLPRFDLVIADEAHQFADAEMAQGVFKRCRVRHRINLTATPSRLIARQVPTVAFSLLDALREGVIADPVIELAMSDYLIDFGDYNQSGELTGEGERKLTKDATDSTMSKIEAKLLDMITRRLKAGASESARLASGRLEHNLEDVYDELGKSMIVARSVEQATYVVDYLTRRGVGATVSDYKVDPESKQIARFKVDKQIAVLVVVDRGTLGFDFPELGALVDLSETKSPNKILQMIGRVVRKSKRETDRKLFLKVAASKMHDYQEHLVGFTMTLAHRETLLEWDGTNLLNRSIPKFGDSEERSGPNTERGQGQEAERNPRPVLGLTFSEFFDRVAKDRNGVLDIYAKTTLAMVKDRYASVRAKVLEAMAKKYDDFYEAHGRLPSDKASDKDERHLASWMKKIMLINKTRFGYEAPMH